MKKLLLLLIVFSPLFSYTQNDRGGQNHTDDLGLKQGKWKSYDDMGHLKYEGQFKDNIPFGEFQYYYPDGKLKAVSHIYNKGKDSRTITYHHNGSLMAEGKYSDRKKDSIWRYYSQYDGILLSEEIYINTLKQGVWKTFYPEQKLAEEKSYLDDNIHGPWIQYYMDGQIKLKGQYINNEKDGEFILFHLNGKIDTKGLYKNSFKEGIWEEFDEEGVSIKKVLYQNGSIIE